MSQDSRLTRVSLRVMSSGEVRLNIPSRVSRKQALEFLEAKKEWILQSKAKMKQRRKVIEMPYTTRSHSLSLNPQPCTSMKAQIADKQAVVTYPQELNYKDDRVQNFIKKVIEEIWRIEAKMMLPQRLSELANKHGFKFSKVSIRNTKTRWGSCSGQNAISLSLSLMSLPDHLIDYILLHELCHTIHKNHSQNFYALLDKVSGGNHKKYQAEVKQQQI